MNGDSTYTLSWAGQGIDAPESSIPSIALGDGGCSLTCWIVKEAQAPSGLARMRNMIECEVT